jgi:FkbM family methyltransferase
MVSMNLFNDMRMMDSYLRKISRYVAHLFKTCYPNKHLSAKTAKLTKLGGGGLAYLRPSFSDYARIQEFDSMIYLPRNDLTDKLLKLKPKMIVDIGANVGLSSLALSRAFASAEKIVGIEAEYENFSVLQKNYAIWAEESAKFNEDSRKRYFPIYAVASDSSELESSSVEAAKLPAGVSASGIFQFREKEIDINEHICPKERSEHTKLRFSNRKVSMAELFDTHLEQDVGLAVVKVDIEGGEEYLFRGPSNWMDKTIFLTVEIHDWMGAPNASKNLLEKLVLHDFAIVPEQDVLHCYNRALLELK